MKLLGSAAVLDNRWVTGSLVSGFFWSAVMIFFLVFGTLGA